MLSKIILASFKPDENGDVNCELNITVPFNNLSVKSLVSTFVLRIRRYLSKVKQSEWKDSFRVLSTHHGTAKMSNGSKIGLIIQCFEQIVLKENGSVILPNDTDTPTIFQ